MRTTLIQGKYLLALLLTVVGCSEERRITTQSSKARELYNAGVSQWEKFYFVEAQKSFEEAIHLDSAFAMAWARLAFVSEGTQNRDKALNEIGRAIALAAHATPYEQLFVRLQGYRLTFSNKQALDLADSMADSYPDEKEVHLVRGNLYELNKNFDAAIRSYRMAIDIDTSYSLAVMFLGYAYSTIGEQEKAVAQMERYIRLAPDAPDPRASFADILFRVGRYDEALQQYQRSLELKPDYWYSAMQIGHIYALKGRLKEAQQQYNKSMASLPQSDQLRANHAALNANLNMRRGAYKEAIRKYQEALGLDSTNGEAAYGLVSAFRTLKNLTDE